LIAQVRDQLMRYPPFTRMEPAQVERFVESASEAYYAPGETLIAPADGPPTRLICVKSGAVVGRYSPDEATPAFAYEAGDLFPVGALLGVRPVAATYIAQGDVFCLLVPAEAVHTLAEQSVPFADFLNRRVFRFLEDSRRALQTMLNSQALDEQTLEAPLAKLVRAAPVMLPPSATVRDALTLMHERRIGSVLVTDGEHHAEGILTRHDVVDRVALAQVPMHAPLSQVMSSPVHTLDLAMTAHDAAILMSRHGVRHVPVTEQGRVVGIVSERDLFALQRLSLKQLTGTIRGAREVGALRDAAAEIRRFARNLLAQGIGARALTALVSHLNDVLTVRLVELVAGEMRLDLSRACWLAFGSEGRSEQTIATDQDNGLVFTSDDPARDRPAWLTFGQRVNQALDACGYPLCKGGVMAGQPPCCLTSDEWLHRFEHWMAHGAPADLLNASIYFDLRPIAGNAELAELLRAHISERAARLPRFVKQLADNALERRPPLNWRGGIDTTEVDGRATIDLKLQGTAIFVDAARVYALAYGIAETGTRARFEAVGRALGLPVQESESWSVGFEFLQMLRLTVQMGSDVPADAANRIDVEALNHIDRRVLRETLRVARQLQQRIELDYRR